MQVLTNAMIAFGCPVVSNRTEDWGCETKFFLEGAWGLLPLLQRNDGGEGWGEEAVFFGKPLSLTLSPFVPHGGRESAPGKSI